MFLWGVRCYPAFIRQFGTHFLCTIFSMLYIPAICFLRQILGYGLFKSRKLFLQIPTCIHFQFSSVCRTTASLSLLLCYEGSNRGILRLKNSWKTMSPSSVPVYTVQGHWYVLHWGAGVLKSIDVTCTLTLYLNEESNHFSFNRMCARMIYTWTLQSGGVDIHCDGFILMHSF